MWKPVFIPLDDALRMAREQNLDLVEISPKAEPPVCRIVDYSKFKYDLKKKAAGNEGQNPESGSERDPFWPEYR